MDQDLQNIPTKSNKRKLRKIDPNKVKSLALLGVAPSDIAKNQNVHPSTITRYLDKININNTALEAFKKNKLNCFGVNQLKALAVKDRVWDWYLEIDKSQFAALTDTAKTGIANAANISLGTTFDKEQVLSGKPTNIIAYIDIIKARDSLKKENEAIEAELKESGVEIPVYNSDPEAVHNQETNVTP